jgi:hypothetical protein
MEMECYQDYSNLVSQTILTKPSQTWMPSKKIGNAKQNSWVTLRSGKFTARRDAHKKKYDELRKARLDEFTSSRRGS